MADTTYDVNSTAWTASTHRSKFYTGMALVMLLVACAGFLPSLIQTSRRHAPVSVLVGLHGVLFFAWLIIFPVQSRLVSARRVALHRKLGVAAALVLALMVPLACATTIGMIKRGFDLSGDLRIEADPRAEAALQLGWLLVFSVFVITALAYRGRPEVHRRLMLFANIALMPAALAHLIGHSSRLAALPKGIIMIPMSMFLAAAIVYDRVKARKFRPLTFGVGMGMFLFGPVTASVIGPSAAWHHLVSLAIR